MALSTGSGHSVVSLRSVVERTGCEQRAAGGRLD